MIDENNEVYDREMTVWQEAYTVARDARAKDQHWQKKFLLEFPKPQTLQMLEYEKQKEALWKEDDNMMFDTRSLFKQRKESEGHAMEYESKDTRSTYERILASGWTPPKSQQYVDEEEQYENKKMQFFEDEEEAYKKKRMLVTKKKKTRR